MKKELNKNKNVFVKKSKMSFAKSTTALTCLVGSLIFYSDLRAVTVTTGMAVATSVASSCTISAGSMTFGEYSGSEITATSVITQDCNAPTFSISLAATPEAPPQTYYLYRGGTVSGTASNQLGVIFTHPGGAMVGSTVALTGTGTGTSGAVVGTITGTIAGSQSGKTSGNFTRTMTLNLVY